MLSKHRLTMPGCHKPSIREKINAIFAKRNKAKHDKTKFACTKISPPCCKGADGVRS